MNPELLYLATLLILLILGTFIFNSIGKSRDDIRKQLDDEIEAKQTLIQTLDNQIRTYDVNKTQNLTDMQIYVLDMYERSNIKIPVEVIDDLHYNRINDEEQIFKFIENQRNFWKLENSKKVWRDK